MVPLDWGEDLSIVGGEGLDERAVLAALDGGARVVLLDLVVSLLGAHYSSRRRHLVRPGQSVLRLAVLPTAITFFLGWWGLGLLLTPVALYRNLRGGVDVTDAVREELLARLEERAARDALEAARTARALAPDAPPEARRARALELLDQGDAGAAWAVVGADVAEGRPPGRDVALLRRLLTGLRDRRLWGRAARVADVLRREHPAEVRGFLEAAAQDVLRRQDDPDGFVPARPLWVKVLFVLAALALGAAILALAIHGRHRPR